MKRLEGFLSIVVGLVMMSYNGYAQSGKKTNNNKAITKEWSYNWQTRESEGPEVQKNDVVRLLVTDLNLFCYDVEIDAELISYSFSPEKYIEVLGEKILIL